MIDEHLFLSAEVRELEGILSGIPEEDVIDRMSFEARLRNVRASLAELPTPRISRKARLTFRGRPVRGSRGIYADFGTIATKSFNEAFVAVAGGFQSLKSKQKKGCLLITGTAVGSFGFELELPKVEPGLFPELEWTTKTMWKIEALLRKSATGTDDDVAEEIEEVTPKGLKKVKDFLALLVSNQAWCGLEFGDRFFRFDNFEQLQTSSARFRDENIKETKESFRGEFQGVLPTSRLFEFKVSGTDELIRGKLAVDLSDPDALNREWLHRKAAVVLKVIKVGAGKPRYLLESLSDLHI